MKINSCFLLLLCMWLNPLLSQTNVGGLINSDTTWNLSGSPYIVTDAVLVDDTVTLTIEAGVEIRFNEHEFLQVEGHLIAKGTEDEPIEFESNESNPTSGIWGGIWIQGSAELSYLSGRYARHFLRFEAGAMDHMELIGAVISHSDTALSFDGSYPDSLLLDHCLFESNQRAVLLDSLGVLKNCQFIANDWGLIGNRSWISQCRFLENGYGAELERSFLRECDFFANGNLGLNEWFCDVRFSDFYENEVGMESRLGPQTHIEFCEFRYNEVGLMLDDNLLADPGAIFQHNALCDNMLYDVQTFAPSGINANLAHNCWCETDSATIAASIYDQFDDISLGMVEYFPFDTTNCFTDRVYPGDANYDQVANLWDLFPIGLVYGAMGPDRPNASLDWIGQEAENWEDSLASMVDIKHVDCDGSGTINSDDIIAILMNYGEMHTSNKTGADSTGIPLVMNFPASNFDPGDTVNVPIVLGTGDSLAEDLYAIGFSIFYDTALIEQGKIEVDFSNSWLGNSGTDLIHLVYDDSLAGRIDICMSRNDQSSVTGFGTLADIIVVIDEDIAKTTIPLELTFGEIQAIDPLENTISVLGINGMTNITLSDFHNHQNYWTRIYPNPSNGNITIKSNVSGQLSMQLYDSMGRKIGPPSQISRFPHSLNFSDLPSGHYFLRLNFEEKLKTYHIQIRD